MSVYSGPVFDMAVNQLGKICNRAAKTTRGLFP